MAVVAGYNSTWPAKWLFVAVALLMIALTEAATPEAVHNQMHQDSAQSTIMQEEHLAATQSRNTSFIDASGSACDEIWITWPSTQLQAMANGTYFVFTLFPSVGNLFMTLRKMLPVIRFFEMGIVLDTQEKFPGFRQAFEPGTILWDVDPAPLKKRALKIEQGGNVGGIHALTLRDGAVVLSDTQLELMKSILGISASTLHELAINASSSNRRPSLRGLFSVLRERIGRQGYVSAEPCTWNMFLRRSPFLLESLELHSPWVPGNGDLESDRRPTKYVGWHIRTPEGESKISYKPNVHRYIIQEEPDVVCPAFESATQAAKMFCKGLANDDLAVYVSSNSKSFGRSCIEGLEEHNIKGGQVDLGLGPNDAHTAFSRNPYAAMNAFLDYVFLLDAVVIIRSASSFSGTIAAIRGFTCESSPAMELQKRQIFVCTSKDSSC